MDSRKDKTDVVDGKWSWVIAFSCCFINCLLYGVARLSGLWMVAALETFQVNRASAALPFSVSTSVRNLSGIFVGYLGQRFGLRATIATGCILASLGAGLCFFVTDIIWIVVCWGGIFGIGFGLATCLLPLAINQHFSTYRGTASGISYSGSYIGSFIFPPLVVILLDKYGLSGTFLVISATFLNGLAVSMLFRAPPKQPQQPKTIKVLNRYDNDDRDLKATDNQLKKIWFWLLQKIKSNASVFKTKEILTASSVPSDNFTLSLDNQDYGKTISYGVPNCELVSYTNCLHRKNSNYLTDTFEDFPVHEQKLPPSSRTCLKRKKVRFKRKFTKFKNLRGKFLINKQRYLGKQLSCFPFENVELISFRHFNCPFYPEINSIHKLLDTNSFCSTTKNEYLSSGYLLPQLSEIIKCEAPIQDVIALGKHGNINTTNESMHKSLSLQDYNQVFLQRGNKESPTSWLSSNSRMRHLHQRLVYSSPSRSSTKCVTQFNSKQTRTSDNNEHFGKSQCFSLRDACMCLFGWFSLYSEPMFVVIAITMSLHTFVVVCMITIIEDFAKDIGIPECQVHYVLMILSTADLLGSLTLGAITDKGFLSRRNFIILSFFGLAICQVSISFSQNLTVLLILVAIYGIFESGIIITFPILIDHFIPQKKQAVAVASSNILSSPSVLLVPLVIGYFRDGRGCYSGVFYCLGITSLFCCFIWFLTPYVFTRHKKKWHFHSNDSFS